MSLYQEIQEIRKDLFRKRFENELNDINGKPEKYEEDIERLEDIKQIIISIDKRREKDKGKRKLEFSEINNMMYKKQWRYLKPFHRVVKMKEYIRENIDENLQKEIIDKVTKLLNKNKLKSSKYVEYNHDICKVIKFNALEINEDGFKINSK